MSVKSLFSCISILFIIAIQTSVSVADDEQRTASITQEYEEAEIIGKSVSEGIHRTNQRSGIPIIISWLHILDNAQSYESDKSSVLAYANQVPNDLMQTLKSVDSGGGGPGFFGVVALSVMSICSGFLVIFAIKKLKPPVITKRNKLIPPENENLLSFTAIFLNNFPAIARLLLASMISSLIFLGLATEVTITGRMFFLALLAIVFIFKLCKILARIVFSPDDIRYRFFTINESLVKPLCLSVYLSLALLLSSIVLINLFNELGASYQTVTWLTVLVGTLIVVVWGVLIFYLKKPIAQMLISEANTKKYSRFYEQIVRNWDRPALLYLLVIWSLWVGLEMSGTVERDGAFIASLFIVPVYFILSYFGKIFINSVVESLALDEKHDDLAAKEENVNQDVGVIVEDNEVITTRINFYFRLIVLISLITWILSIWGVNIPYGSFAVKAIFESSITLVLAFFCWKIASPGLVRAGEKAGADRGAPRLVALSRTASRSTRGTRRSGRVPTSWGCRGTTRRSPRGRRAKPSAWAPSRAGS